MVPISKKNLQLQNLKILWTEVNLENDLYTCWLLNYITRCVRLCVFDHSHKKQYRSQAREEDSRNKTNLVAQASSEFRAELSVDDTDLVVVAVIPPSRIRNRYLTEMLHIIQDILSFQLPIKELLLIIILLI